MKDVLLWLAENPGAGATILFVLSAAFIAGVLCGVAVTAERQDRRERTEP